MMITFSNKLIITKNELLPYYLNDFSIVFFWCQIYEKIFIICVKSFIKLRICKISTVRFESQTLKFKNLRPRQFKHIRLSHKLKNNVFIKFSNHYAKKI